MPAFSSDEVGASTDTMFARLDAVSVSFNNVDGHAHNGAPGQGAPIDITSIQGINPYVSKYEFVVVDTSIGGSAAFDGTSYFTGLPVSDGNVTPGILKGIGDMRAVFRLREDNALPILDDDDKEIFAFLDYTEDPEAFIFEFYTLDGTGGISPATPPATNDVAFWYQRNYIQGDVGQQNEFMHPGLFSTGAAGGGGGGGGLFVVDNFTGTSITMTNDARQAWRYTGGSAQTLASVDLTALTDGEELEIYGTSNDNTITVSTAATGILAMNGEWVGYQYSIIRFRYDATSGGLVEVSRNGL